MREAKFLCLAVSTRDGGNCIAGIDLDSGEWIRPINPKTSGALSDGELIVLDSSTGKRRFLAPLDVFQIKLEKSAGTNSQPENWETVPASYENPHVILERLDQRACLDRLFIFH